MAAKWILCLSIHYEVLPAGSMCAWANTEKPESVNFADIVSEELSRHLETKKESAILDVSKDGWIWIESDEADGAVKCTEENIHETSTLSDGNHEKNFLTTNSRSDLEKKEIKDIQDQDSCDIFNFLEYELTHSSENFYSHKLQSSEEVINKYDIVLIGKMDDCKLSSFSSNFRTDGKVLDFKSSYRFFNSLKVYIPQQEGDRNEFPINRFVMDPYTHILLYNVIVSRLLKSVDCVINSKICDLLQFLGTLDPSYQHAIRNWPERCAIKVFEKVSRLKYSLCYLYKEELNEPKRVHWWAQRAMDNLKSVREAGVSCPEVIKLKRHILVMCSIGTDKKPAPKLKYAGLSYPDFVKAYKQVENTMKILYQKANLIQGDMSEYNILWQDGQCYFEDFSHCVDPSHENGYYFLHSDCVNITNYFEKRIPDIESAEELFIGITGFCFGNKPLLMKMQQLYKKNPYILHKPTEELKRGK